MIGSFDKVQTDYNELKQKVEESTEMANSTKILIDVYMSYFDECSSVFKENKRFAKDLALIQDEIIDYLILKFAEYKNCEAELIINALINNDLNLGKKFGYHAGQHYIQKIGFGFLILLSLIF